MAIEQLTIPIPEGYELESKTRRIPKEGELLLAFEADGTISMELCTTNDWSRKYYIVRKKWVPPISCPKGITFYKSEDRPDIWYFIILRTITPVYAKNVYSDFTPPPTSPYTVE